MNGWRVTLPNPGLGREEKKMKNVRGRFARSLWVGLLLIGTLLLGACAGEEAKTARTTITVVGVGESSGAPDTASIQLGVSLVDEDLSRAVQEAHATSGRITQAMLTAGLTEEDVRTTNYSIWREDVHDPQTGMPTGESRYHVDTTVEVVVHDVGRLGEIIGIGLDAGANNVFGINFAIENTAPLEAEARAMAMADVEARASQIAGEMGVELGKPVAIAEGTGGLASPFATYGLKGEAIGIGGAGPAPISPGEMTVTIQITATYEVNE